MYVEGTSSTQNPSQTEIIDNNREGHELHARFPSHCTINSVVLWLSPHLQKNMEQVCY